MQFHRLALPPNLTSTPVDFRTAQSRHAVDAARDDYSSLWSRSIAAWMTSASAGMSAPPPSGACSRRTASRRIMVSWVRTGRSASIVHRPVASSGSAANAPLRRSRSEALRFTIKLSRSVVMSRSCTRPVAGPRSSRDPARDAACAVFPSAVADRDRGLPRVHTRGAGDTRAWRSRNLQIAWVGCEHRLLLCQARRVDGRVDAHPGPAGCGGLGHRRERSVEEVPDAAGEVALEAAQRLAPTVALGELALQVGARGRVDAQARDGDAVQRAVELAIAAAVEAHAVAAPRRARDRRGAGVH